MRKVRARELQLARAQLDEALRGHGRTLFVSGPAGIGKSAFVDAVASSASGWLVVRIEGVELESHLVWAGLSQLIHRLRDHVAGLRSTHQRIIESLVDPTSGPAPDAFAAAVSIHALLAQVADGAPTLLVVEDHHWLDPDTIRVLDFVGRRLEGLRLMMIATTRSPDGVAGDSQLALEPLSADEAAEVLLDLGLGVVTARELAGRIGGHPLALVQAARTLSPEQRAGIEPLPSPFPVSADDLPTAVATIIRGLPDGTVDAVLLLSAAGSIGRGWPAVFDAAGVSAHALVPAEDAGIVVVAPDALRFAHPLFRAAVYAEATPAARRAAHGALAASERDAGRAAWHEARAAVGHDDALAARLADVAEEAVRTGAYSSAFEAWHRAGELSSTDASADVYELRAAEAALWAGNNAPAQEVIGRFPPIESCDTSLVTLAAAYEARAGHADAAYDLFVRAGALSDDADPDRAARAYLDAARTRLRTGHIAAAGGALERLSAVLARVTDQTLLAQAEVVLAVVDCLAGGPIERLLVACDAVVPTGGPLIGDLTFLADSVALALAFLRRRDDALDLVERLRSAASEHNLPSLIPYIDTAQACALSAIDLPGCMIAASSAVAWADAIGQPNLAATAVGYLANVQAALGDPGVFATAERIGASGTENGWVTERMMRGFYWTTLGQPERVLDELLPLHEWAAGELKTVMFWQGDLGEAAVRAGQIDLAEEVVKQLHGFNAVFPNRWLEGAAARIEGLLVDVDACGELFEISTTAFAADEIRLGEARSELLWGERLRRSRRRAEARGHLARAKELFVQIGAGRWVERCEHELIASGGATAPPDHALDADRVLTPQELQIARLCVEGRSNRDIGAAVFISARTVETHLSAIYRKLGVRNRAELARAAAHDPALRRPPA
ncbi:MAG: LuxR C-terminal-related transcriptional regulator [Ilumatobacteraceae bacterium]